MKYIFINLLFFIAGLSFALAQNLSLSDVSGALNNADYVYIWGDSSIYTQMDSHFEVHNNGSSAIDVKVKKTEIIVISGSENLFCWGMCYDTATFVSSEMINIAAGSSNLHDFGGYYKPKGNLGQTTIMYTFFNNADSNDSVCVNVVYGATAASIEESSPVIEFSNAYPNPASSIVYFNYALNSGNYNATLSVSDILGSEVIHQTIVNSNRRTSIDVTNLESGVYFYSLQINGKAQFTRKLIIRH